MVYILFYENTCTYILQAHAHLTSVDYCLNGLWQMKSTCSPELASVVTDVCTFFVIHGIVTESGDFLEVTDKAFEPRHEKTNILVSDLVRHKPGCTATEVG